MLEVVRNINAIYDRKRARFTQLCLEYAARAENLFNTAQDDNFFWNNQTFQAQGSVFGGVIDEKDFVGFFLAHGKDYGVYLELADDRKNEALRPIINSLWKDFKADVQELYG